MLQRLIVDLNILKSILNFLSTRGFQQFQRLEWFSI